MANRPNRYKEMERNITIALVIYLILFITFLFASGNDTGWLKAITFIIILILSGLCLAVLYLTKEIMRQRSMWMTVAATAILVCVLFSLILRFPSPNPLKAVSNESSTDTSVTVVTEE